MLVGTGTDILKISRLALEKLPDGDPFLFRAFTENERAEAKTKGNPNLYYAGRFAGKEAVYKAISACKIELRPGEIEILGDENGAPKVRLFGKTKERFEKFCGGEYGLFVSLSYDTEYAVAFAAAEKL